MATHYELQVQPVDGGFQMVVTTTSFGSQYTTTPERLKATNMADALDEAARLVADMVAILEQCERCDRTGYLDESTLTNPVFCPCQIGQFRSKVKQ